MQLRRMDTSETGRNRNHRHSREPLPIPRFVLPPSLAPIFFFSGFTLPVPDELSKPCSPTQPPALLVPKATAAWVDRELDCVWWWWWYLDLGSIGLQSSVMSWLGDFGRGGKGPIVERITWSIDTISLISLEDFKHRDLIFLRFFLVFQDGLVFVRSSKRDLSSDRLVVVVICCRRSR